MEELEEENDHLKKQNTMLNEAKNKLRLETSQLTAENMVCVRTCRVPEVIMTETNVCLCSRT